MADSGFSTGSIKYGLFSMNMGACSYAETAAAIARLAEDGGFESAWATSATFSAHTLAFSAKTSSRVR